MQELLFERPIDLQDVLFKLARARHVYIKFLSANDLGLTGSNQDGVYVAREAWPILFDEPGPAGENRKRENVQIEWGRDFATPATFLWYGQSKSEYRITRLGPAFRDQEEQFLGALFLLFYVEEEQQKIYHARALDREDDIETVLHFLGVTPAECGGLLAFNLEERLRGYAGEYVAESGGVFPDTGDISRRAQRVYRDLYRQKERQSADAMLLELIGIEYALFRAIEKSVYASYLEQPFRDVEELLAVSSEINNRRKSRAGRSLENHLTFLFELRRVPFSFGQATEEGKRPDFIFPSIEQYRDPRFASEKLFFLGAKTTCKDRWRQVLNEADRAPIKHLCTLQQGITSAQLREMREASVIPVVPKQFHDFCKKEDRDFLLSIESFLQLVLDANGPAPELF